MLYVIRPCSLIDCTSKLIYTNLTTIFTTTCLHISLNIACELSQVFIISECKHNARCEQFRFFRSRKWAKKKIYYQEFITVFPKREEETRSWFFSSDSLRRICEFIRSRVFESFCFIEKTKEGRYWNIMTYLT